jgi:hypothetical protein
VDDTVTAETYGGEEQQYQQALLEQYKIYVEMADRISARRSLANGFFLSLNTVILGGAGLLANRPDITPWLLLPALGVLLIQSATWFLLVRSYRQLNAAKYMVVGALEERLPASPYWRAEWKALGEGRNTAVYWPLTHLEQWIPLVFAALYVVGFVIAVAA